MKFINLKILKFSTIIKKIDLTKYSFPTFNKRIKYIKINCVKFFNVISENVISAVFKITKYLGKIFTLNTNLPYIPKITVKIGKYFSLKKYSVFLIKKLNIFNNKFFLIHLPSFICFFGFLYFFIPTFYNYNEKDIENIICTKNNIECSIKGNVSYSFYPTPRIKITNLLVTSLSTTQNPLVKINQAEIILSIKNLLAKEKHKFKSLKVKDYEINYNFINTKKYKKILSEEINFIPMKFSKGKVIFFNGENYVAVIKNAKIDLISKNNKKQYELRGIFLNDKIYINLDKEKEDNNLLSELVIKMPDLNLLTKVSFNESQSEKNLITGNILIKKDKQRFAGIYSYKNNIIEIKKSNLRNIFLEGKLTGEIKFTPYFDFDLDLSLNSINFTKLYTSFLSFNELDQKKLFKVNKKLNGKLSLSSDKVYSSYNLVKSFESQIKLNNGNILIEQFLLNFGKLGAADVLGTIANDEKYTNFKYETNIFIENQKKFLSKFGIYNKKTIPTNLFVSGNFDLKNIKNTFYEVSDEKKLSQNDTNFIENEFNDFMLEDGYKKLFLFPRFKDFVKSILSESN